MSAPNPEATVAAAVPIGGVHGAALRSITEIDGPHLVMQTYPDEVTAVITTAAAELS